MSIQLRPEEREALQDYLKRRPEPTRRQKADALLGLAQGQSLSEVSQRVGIRMDDLEGLVAKFSEEGLEGIGIRPELVGKSGKRRRTRTGSIVKTPEVCGGSARVVGTRIPVWQLVEARDSGVSEAQLLLDFPTLKAVHLAEAWEYARLHPDEIATEIHENEVA
jgi:uncharacterized protein (DUF433 family)